MKMSESLCVCLLLLLLCCCFSSSTGPADNCDLYAPVGGDTTVPLTVNLEDSDMLTWTHESTVIVKRRNGKFTPGKQEDISKNGSLLLKKVMKDKAGMYKAEIHTRNGQTKAGDLKPSRLCILDPVSKPQLTFSCPTKELVKFSCIGTQGKDVSVKWFKNKNLMKETVGSLTLSAKEVEKDEFTCVVSNRVSNKGSDVVKQNCYKPEPLFPAELYGINTWIFVGAGAGIVVILMMVVIVCCVKNRRKKRLLIKDEEELRLGWSNPNQQQQRQHQHPPNQRTQQHPPNQHKHQHPPNQHKHHHHQHQQPAGHTGPRPSRSKQQRNRAPEHTGAPLQPGTPLQPGAPLQPSPRRTPQAPRPAADDEQPPPLPKPRKKAGKDMRA